MGRRKGVVGHCVFLSECILGLKGTLRFAGPANLLILKGMETPSERTNNLQR
jgi:hypothetical protein